MNKHMFLRPAASAALAAALVIALAVLAAFTPRLCAAAGQRYFASPDAAMTAFGDAVAGNDEPALKTLLGEDFRHILPPVGAELRDKFLSEWKVSHTIQDTDANHAVIAVGNDGWTLPIPLVKSAQGWHFDTAAGAEEMRARRIGRNELAVMQALLAVYDAQDEYAQTYHDGNKMLVYASKLASSPGKHDGLYWPTGPDEAPSPLGVAFLTAGKHSTESAGYYGYHYKLLTSQGPHAPGGAYNYLVHDKLFGGFGVVAWPVRYGDTGIKTFMVSHDGQVYERDLGPDSAAKAEAMTSFDPGPGWSKSSP